MPKDFIDFKAIKERVSLVSAMKMLPLEMRLRGSQYRGPCPSCQDGGDRSLVVTPDKGFYCHSAHTGGDVIAFVAHVKDLNQKEAAAYLAEHFRIVADTRKPAQHSASPRQPAPTSRTEGLKPLDYLTTDHEVLDLLGLSPEVCGALGAGYAAKGTMNGRVCVPLRLEDGTLVGYFGIATKADQSPLLKFPDNLDERCGQPQLIETEEAEPPKSKDELRKLLRVV